MKRPRSREVPGPAAAAILVLALITGVVTGQEGSFAISTIASTTARPVVEPAAEDDLDLSQLKRMANPGGGRDLFPGPRVPPPAAPPPPPPRLAELERPTPVAPPLPYRYLGRMVKAEEAIVYLLRDQGMRVARAGDVLDDAYRVEAITEANVRFTFLQLGTTQTLPIPAAQ